LAPGLNAGSFGGQARIAIRGIGFDTINPGQEGRVAYHLDGIYVSRPSAQLGTFFDVSQVEVLRGPQGTLYGRNATGGSINVITNQPTDAPSGYVDLTVGNYRRIAVDAALGGPITQNIDARIAVSANSHSGYGEDTYLREPIDDANTHGVRGIVRYKPDSRFKWTLSADYYGEDDHNYGIHYFGQAQPGQILTATLFGGFTAANVRDITSSQEPENHRELYGVNSDIEYDLDGVVLKSLTGYRHSDYKDITDLDQTNLGLAAPFPFFESAHQVSQEFQASGSFGRSKWIGGAYFFDETIFGGSQVPFNLELLGGPNLLVDGYKVQGTTHTSAVAVYGQLDLALTDRLTAIFGGREGYEKATIHDESQFDLARPYNPGDPIINLPGFPRADAASSTAFTPKIGLEFSASDDVNLYVTVSKGFKSGGFDVGVLEPAFKPETLWDYEGGIKATTFDGRLRTNLSAFYYDYTNIQVSIVNGNQVLTQNAAASRLYGTELEFTAIPARNFQIDGSLTYLYSEYLKYTSVDPSNPGLGPQNLAGNTLTQAPKFTANVGVQNRWDVSAGSLTLRGELNYSSRIFYTPFDNPAISTPENVKFNAFLTYQHDGGHWNATLFVRNLFDRTTIANALVGSSAVGNPAIGVLSAPRTFGARIGYRF
jgi:iron complex outermembrane receptor protein